MTDTSTGRRHDPALYEIRVQGHLDPRWAAWFDGLSFTSEVDGTTVLVGAAVDQTALYGALQKVRDLGLPLVSVTRVDTDRPVTSTTSR